MKQQLTYKEIVAINMGLQVLIEDMQAAAKDSSLNFNPGARADMKDILANAVSAKAKLTVSSGHEIVMEPYKEGDEKDFLTKES